MRKCARFVGAGCIAVLAAMGVPGIASAAELSVTEGDKSAQVKPVFVGLFQNGEEADAIAPDTEPFDIAWGLDNFTEEDIALTGVSFEATDFTNPDCAQYLYVTPEGKERFVEPIVVRAGGTTERMIAEGAFRFEFEAPNECQRVSFEIPTTVTYQLVASKTDGAVTVAGQEAATVAVQPGQETAAVPLAATFTAVTDGLSDPEAALQPSGTVQFFVGGKPVGEPVTAAAAAAGINADLAIGKHEVTAVLTDPVYGTVNAGPASVEVTADESAEPGAPGSLSLGSLSADSLESGSAKGSLVTDSANGSLSSTGQFDLESVSGSNLADSASVSQLGSVTAAAATGSLALGAIALASTL